MVFMKKLRKMKKQSIEKKKKQYKEIACKINKVIQKAGFQDPGNKIDKGKFELAKTWLINNELMSAKYVAKTFSREILVEIEYAVTMLCTFVLGVFTTLWANDEVSINTFPWKAFLAVFVIFLMAQFAFKFLGEGIIEDYNLRILREITYDEYMVLIDDEDIGNETED